MYPPDRAYSTGPPPQVEFGLDASPLIQDAKILDLAATLQARRESVWGGLGLEKTRCIDVMVMEMSPEPKIRSFPGKQLHHPMDPRP